MAVALATETEESNRQLIAAWSQFALSFPAGRIVVVPGLVLAFAHSRINFFNAAFLSEPVESLADLERRLRIAVQYGQSSGVAWFLAICDEIIPPMLRSPASALIESLGYSLGDPWTGMVTEALTAPPRDIPDLAFRPVADSESRGAASDINCLCYDVALQWGREAMDRPDFWPATVFGSVAYVAWQAVATATTIVVGDTLYVALVATLPRHRRRGYAEAVLRHSLARAQAATGLTRLALHATAPGLPVYRHMGFRPVAGFSMYSLRR